MPPKVLDVPNLAIPLRPKENFPRTPTLYPVRSGILEPELRQLLSELLLVRVDSSNNTFPHLFVLRVKLRSDAVPNVYFF